MIALPVPFRALAVAACLALLLVIAAAAQDEPMELRSTADYVYGQSMNFHLAATNVGEVETVTLFIRLGVSPDSYAVEVPIAPGAPLDLSYALDLSQTRLPPFGSITYWWELKRAIGSPLRVPEQVISYVDDQFSWRQLVATDTQGGGSVRIHWTGDNEALGDQARDIIYEMLPPTGRLIPIDHIVPFDVYIYPSSADLGAALRLAGREYTPGQTYPDLGVVLAVVVNPETAEAELRRELAQGLVDLLLFQSLNQFAYNVPPWLGRGLAGAVRGQRDPALDEVLQAAVAAESTIPLAELCAGMPIESDLAAAQSEAILAYIQDNYGAGAVRTLVTAFAGEDDCPTALQKAIQLTPEQLEAAWRRSSSGDQGTRAVAEIAVWLALVLAGFGLAGLLLLRPRRA